MSVRRDQPSRSHTTATNQSSLHLAVEPLLVLVQGVDIGGDFEAVLTDDRLVGQVFRLHMFLERAEGRKDDKMGKGKRDNWNSNSKFTCLTV